jgi:methionyl-tRNA synthetase
MRRVLFAAIVVALLYAAPAGAWTWPVAGPVLQPFVFDPAHPYAAGQHRGIDVGAQPGDVVSAPAGGTVTFAGTVPSSGLTVTITTADGYAVTLTHLGSITAAAGAVVVEGDPVALAGSSGVAELPQTSVHLGIRVAAQPQGYLDPLGFLPPIAQAPSPAPPVPQPAANPVAAPTTPAPSAAPPVGQPRAAAPAAPPAVAAAAEPNADDDGALTVVGGSSPRSHTGIVRARHVQQAAAAPRPVPASRVASIPTVHAPAVAARASAASSTVTPAAPATASSLRHMPRHPHRSRRPASPRRSACDGSQRRGSRSPRWRALPPPCSRAGPGEGSGLSWIAMTFYVTTPIYYVNDRPHIGHAYTTIAADILARHHKQRGEETFFLTGVDEHATKVWRAAEAQGLGAQEFVDQIAEAWRSLAPKLNAESDFFIRTTDEGHKSFVREFLTRIHENGDVYEDVYAGLYCVSCEEFKSEDELIDGKCAAHGTVPEWIEEKNYFFRLSNYRDALLELYDQGFVLPEFRRNEVRSFVESGLHDFSISRAGQPWGIPLPWDETQVAYVWADALVNYLSALTYARPGSDLRETFWPEVRHLVGKDIIRFHCVYWPAMLLSAGYAVPKQVFAHGWLLLDDLKISKSLGNVLDPYELVETYGADAVRYWCARAVPFGQDGSASLADVSARYERELGNDLGNLLSRTTAMIARFRDGGIPSAPGRTAELADEVSALQSEVPAAIDAFDLTGAIDRVWTFVRALNRYVTEQKPWELAKDEANAARLDQVVYDLADGLRVCAVALSAYLPATAPKILAALGQPEDVRWEQVEYGRLVPVSGIEAAQPLFPRLEPAADAA